MLPCFDVDSSLLTRTIGAIVLDSIKAPTTSLTTTSGDIAITDIHVTILYYYTILCNRLAFGVC